MATESKPIEITKALQHLVSVGKDGWWPYNADQTAYSIEATAYALLALRQNADVVNKSVDFLISAQLDSGGWGTTPGVAEWDYTTYLALFALNVARRQHPGIVTRTASACAKAHDLLLDGRTEFLTPAGRVFFLMWSGPSYDYARGWPWMAKTFHWVEPTCLALLAIDASEIAGKKLLKAADHARAYLAEVSCVDGGWNYGNRIVLGAPVPPMAVNTAQGILALQAQPQGALVASALAYLDRADNEFMSIVETAWSALARDAVGRPSDKQRERLASHQAEDGSFSHNIMASAMAAIACGIPENGNPFKFASARS